MLQLKTIHSGTFELLCELSSHESLNDFALAGGTALALQLGHRISIDLDFLCHKYPLLKPVKTRECATLYSLEDIAAMKLNAIANRGAKKDFYDIFSLLDCFSLSTMLDFFRKKIQANE